jgi:hypothetical protein
MQNNCKDPGSLFDSIVSNWVCILHFTLVILQFTTISLEQPRDIEPTGDLFHLLGHHLLGFSDGLIHSGHNQIL